MKDLYRRIGLPSQTDDRLAIERAIAGTSRADSTSARAARHVLLDADRKAVYDRTRTVVMRVGQLRANLGLSRSPHWLASDCGDFDTAPFSTISQLQALRDRKLQESGPGSSSRYLGGFFLLGAVSLVVVIIAVMLEENTSKGARRTSPGPNRSSSAGQSPTYHASPGSTKPLPPAETRADRVRKLVTKRLERAGLPASATNVEVAVQRIIEGQSDPLPLTGVLTRSFSGEGVAPLEIKTRFGSNYYIKVVEWATKANILTIFIRGGEPFETMIPVGSYEVKYAAGQAWFGRIVDFGEDASYSRCDDRFDFTRTYSGYEGYTIELILQERGNLQTDPITPEEF